MMIELGQNIAEFEFSLNDFVGVLLFSEIPTTLIYSDTNKNPIIKEWVDCTDDGNINRSFYFKSTKALLKQFLDGDISHQDFINKSVDGLLYFEDKSSEESIRKFVISIIGLPADYKSSFDFYYKSEYGVDEEKIIKYFELGSVKLDISKTNEVKDIATFRNVETYNIHLESSLGVGYGTIKTETLAKILFGFEKFYKDISLDFLRGKQRGELRPSVKEKEEYDPFITTQIYLQKAESYSVFIKPVYSIYNLFNKTSDTELIAEKLFNLIISSQKEDTLKIEYNNYSEFVFKSYKQFLKNIYEDELKIDLFWYSPTTRSNLNSKITYVIADNILLNIDNLSIVEEDTLVLLGKFEALNCNTRHFEFFSNSREHFKGYIGREIDEDLKMINFVNLYEVEILRKIVKEGGVKEAKITNTIIKLKIKLE